MYIVVFVLFKSVYCYYFYYCFFVRVSAGPKLGEAILQREFEILKS